MSITQEQRAAIGRRARAIAISTGGDPKKISVDAIVETLDDVITCGCDFDVDRWIASADIHFAHDLIGILRHYDPASGGFSHNFVPRFQRR